MKDKIYGEARRQSMGAGHALFLEASRRGCPTSPEERRRLFGDVAVQCKASAEQLEASMYADLDSEMVLQSAPETDPIELLKEYNLSLIQTLLFNASEMTFTAVQVTLNLQANLLTKRGIFNKGYSNS